MRSRPRWPVGRLLRWHGALFQLVAAGAAGLGAGYLATHEGNAWCSGNSFSCSLDTNLLGVVAIGGATSYWYFGLRRGLLLNRYRRRLRALVQSAQDHPDVAGLQLDEDATARVLEAYRPPWLAPRMTLVVGTAGSGRARVYAESVVRLASRGSWAVPVPLGVVSSGAPEEVLACARQQLNLVLRDANAHQDLVDWLWRSLLRCQRLLLVVDDIEEVGPSLSLADRELAVRRLVSSTEQLRLPVLGTSRSDLLDSPPGSVLEVPELDVDAIRGRLRGAVRLDDPALAMLVKALVGPLATPAALTRVVGLLRRSRHSVLATLREAGSARGDLALWDLLLREHVVPGAVLAADHLRALAFVLLTTGLREVAVLAGPQWAEAAELAGWTGGELRRSLPRTVEVRSLVEGGFLDPASSRLLLRFASPEVQAVLAGRFLADRPARVADLVAGLGADSAARAAVAGALRLDRPGGRVHAELLAALDTRLPAAAEAAALGLAVRHPPAGLDEQTMAGLAARLALTLADRVTATGGPVLSPFGLRDAVTTLDRYAGHDAERHLLLALHSSSFPVRLAVALALLRRASPRALVDSVESWIAVAESSAATGVQHQLGLALWFCPYLREHDPDGRGGELYVRGMRLAAAPEASPLLYETSLCRGFKLAAWARRDRPVDQALLELFDTRPRFWYSRVSLLHAVGIRLASRPTDAAMDPGPEDGRAHTLLRRAAAGDPHPLVGEAARLALVGIAEGRAPETFAWLAETDVAQASPRLDDDAHRLLADVSLLLNLIYCAEPWPEPLSQLIADSARLPECIRRPATREQYMRGGCPPECPFGLCPYPGPARRPRGRGELSSVFCRTEAGLAETLPGAPWHDRRARRELAEFWRYAERHLATEDGWEINL